MKLAELRAANVARQAEWDRDDRIAPAYRSNALAGEVGEACNVVKKLERERLGINGSRDTVEHLGEELADVLICVDLLAMQYGIDLAAALVTASLDVAPDRREQVRAFLTSYYGEDATSGQALDAPMRTITAKARMGLVTVAGVEHVITDIGMRMLKWHELLAAQFGPYADGYDMSAAKSEADKVRLIGNSVCPQVAEALVRANLNPRSERRAA